MKKGLFSLRVIGAAIVLTAVAAAPALADPTVNWSSLAVSVDTTSCSTPLFSQPFAGYKDSNYYALAPGQAPDAFLGAGWTLTGGAHFVTTTLADGTQGQVLDVPSGATAVSPPMCVTNAYPTARTMVRDTAGGAGLQMFVDYTANGAWGKGIATGSVHGPGSAWGASGVINIHAGNGLGWQEARFGFVGGGGGNDTQIYNFYVDPRMK